MNNQEQRMLKGIIDLMDNDSCGNGLDSVVMWKGHAFPVGIGKKAREKWFEQNKKDLFKEKE